MSTHPHKCPVHECPKFAPCYCLPDFYDDEDGRHAILAEADNQPETCEDHETFLQCDYCGLWQDPENIVTLSRTVKGHTYADHYCADADCIRKGNRL